MEFLDGFLELGDSSLQPGFLGIVIARELLEEMHQPQIVANGKIEWGLGTILPVFGRGAVFKSSTPTISNSQLARMRSACSFC